MRFFPIDNPVDGKEQRIYYNNKDDKKELLQEVILDYWSGYCNSHWIWLDKFEEHKWNYEDKTKYFLNRCANFLLMGEYNKHDILSGNDIARIKTNELSLDGDWQNEDIEIELEETVEYLNRSMKENYSTDNKILETDFDNRPIISNKKSKTDKILEIYSVPDEEVDNYLPIHISHTFNVWDKTTKIIKGRDGLIDKTKPYVAEWCIVDTNNEFIFQGNKYKINEKVKQYSPRSKKPKYDDYKNDYQMDKILTYEQNEHLFFFDQNIDRIDNDLILKP